MTETSDLKTLVEQLKALSNPQRLRVLSLLSYGEMCVCQVAESLQMPLSSVSEALRELRRAGFVNERKEGRWVYVSLVDANNSPILEEIIPLIKNFPETSQYRARF